MGVLTTAEQLWIKPDLSLRIRPGLSTEHGFFNLEDEPSLNDKRFYEIKEGCRMQWWRSPGLGYERGSWLRVRGSGGSWTLDLRWELLNSCFFWSHSQR